MYAGPHVSAIAEVPRMPGRLTIAMLFGAAVIAGLPVTPPRAEATSARVTRDDDRDRTGAERHRRENERRRTEETRRRADERERAQTRRRAEERARDKARLGAEDGRRHAAVRARIDQMQREAARKSGQPDRDRATRDALRPSHTESPANSSHRAPGPGPGAGTGTGPGPGPALHTLRRNTRAELGIDRVPSARYFRVHFDAGGTTVHYVTTIDHVRYRLAPRDEGPVFDPLDPYSGVVDVPSGLWTTRIGPGD